MSELDNIIGNLNEASDKARNAALHADDASNNSDDVRGTMDSIMDYANDASAYSSDAAETIDEVIGTLEAYLEAQNEKETKEAEPSFIAVLEFLGNKLSDIKSIVSSATNLVSNALTDMNNSNLPLEERSDRFIEASTDEAQEEAKAQAEL